MGIFSSRQNIGVEEVDHSSNTVYRYPPKTGNYFGSHFVMGGERFDTPQPESYLFGENVDLNFLGSRPTPFPYPPPQTNEPTKTLRSLVNIRKESLRLVKILPNLEKGESIETAKTVFNIEFIFDCDSKCNITIYYFVTEEVYPNGIVYSSKYPSLTSDTYHYKRGANQLFAQPSHVFDPSRYNEDELTYHPDKEIFPIAIHCIAQEGDDNRQSHTTIAVVERYSDGSYVLKALKQKIFVDGLSYLLQEIYGIENKSNEITKCTINVGNAVNASTGSDVETEDNGSECVICMSDTRDTLILPCRHLCLCNKCADSLRYQANNCPICRAPFRALLQIRALQKCNPSLSCIPILPHTATTISTEGSCEHIPAGYEAVSLIEALNGPYIRATHQSYNLDSNTNNTDIAPQILNRSLEKKHKNQKIVASPEFEDESQISQTKTVLHRESDGVTKDKSKNQNSSKRKEKQKYKDVVSTVDETSLTHDETQEEDMDSEAEKLSPLLLKETVQPLSRNESRERLQSNNVLSNSTEIEETPITTSNREAVTCISPPSIISREGLGEDSDYYTPDDPTTTILSPVNSDEKKINEKLSSDMAIPKETSGNNYKWSYPGTPLSASSQRSSGTSSFSSSDSTKHLLTERTNPLKPGTLIVSEHN